MKFLRAALGALGVSFCLGAPITSQAALQLCLDDGVGGLVPVCLVDGGAGDFNTGLGQITFIGGYGSWSINVATAVGNSANPEFGIDLNSINIGVGTLYLSMSETNLAWGAPPSSLLSFGGAIGGVTGGSISYQLFVDDSNTMFGMPSSGLVFGGTSSGGAFAASGQGYVTVTDPFSMTALVTIVHSAPASTSFNFIGTVPEPGSLALLSLGLAGLAVVARRRRNS